MKKEWQSLRIDPARLRRDVETLAAIGRSSEGALIRHAFSPAYEEARQWLHSRMREAGLKSRDDAAGNVVGRLGPAGSCVLSGSHIDTVPDGGSLDGTYGVLAAIECARVIREARLESPLAFEVVVLVEEAGRYLDALGSRAVVGDIELTEVLSARSPGNDSLAEAMRGAGFDPFLVDGAKRSPGDVSAFVELHIEQGPDLEAKGTSIGIVKALVGTQIVDLTFRGEADHSGTTSMDARKDAFMAAAEYAYKARSLALRRGTSTTRLTFGVIDAHPQVTNVVPSHVRLRQEFRDASEDVLADLLRRSTRLAAHVGRRHGVDVNAERVATVNAATMSLPLQDLAERTSDRLGYSSIRLVSGAGHDSQVMMSLCPAALIYVPTIGGKGYRRDEWTDWPDLEKGANVLLQMILELMLGK